MSIDKVRGTDTLTLRLTKEDKAALDELVEVERVELAARGVPCQQRQARSQPGQQLRHRMPR